MSFAGFDGRCIGRNECAGIAVCKNTIGSYTCVCGEYELSNEGHPCAGENFKFYIVRWKATCIAYAYVVLACAHVQS